MNLYHFLHSLKKKYKKLKIIIILTLKIDIVQVVVYDILELIY